MTAVYFDCPDNPAPNGGIKQIYRHVDVLNGFGVPAWVVHSTDGFRCGWFDNRTPVRYATDLSPGVDDLLVLPASRSAGQQVLSERFPGLRQVVFNQDCYLTFKDADLLAGVDENYRSLTEHPDTIAVITVSRDSATVLRFLFPAMEIHTVKCGIDTTVFRFAAEKDRVIAFVAKKNKILREVLNGLRVRGSIGDYSVAVIDNMHESQVAAVMRRSLVFLTAVTYEGFGLPAAEAMASGCLVVGFDGRGSREYFTPKTGFPVPTGDVMRYIETVEDVLRLVEDDRDTVDALRRNAASSIGTAYSLEQEADSIASVWDKILGVGEAT